MDVSVTYHAEAGTWWAESPALPGFTAVAEDFAGVRALVAEAVSEEYPGATIVPSYQVADASLPTSWSASRAVATGAQVADHSPGGVRSASGRPVPLTA